MSDTPGNTIRFPPFRLDLDAGLLRRGDQPLPLRAKTWAVLKYLAERPGILVGKDELLDAVWRGVSVSEATLTKSISEIRAVLQDDPRAPRFLETVHRRGFRFLAGRVAADGSSRGGAVGAATPLVVCRDAELARLEDLLATAATGARQVVFVTGEAGIGKTTLLDAFAASIAPRVAAGEVWLTRGHCLRSSGGQEPYMAVLEALDGLTRGPAAAPFVEALRTRAPGWLVQLPWLLAPEELGELRAGLVDGTPERMLRVFGRLLETVTAARTVVLVLEDLHWADASTLDLVAMLAQGTARAAVLVLATYRPAEAIVQAGALATLRRELTIKRRCVTVPLDPLPLAGVRAYLDDRFGPGAVAPALVDLLHAHTDGHPLFLVTVADYLVSHGWLGPGCAGTTPSIETLDRDIPSSLRELVEMEIDEADPFAVAVLEAGAVAGFVFDARAAAAGVEAEVEQVEAACERLQRSQRFVRRAIERGLWSDGTAGGQYGFLHAVHQRVLYDRIPPGRRQLLHQRIGARLAIGYGSRAVEAAAELAAHFEQSGDDERAIAFLEHAAAGAARRFAPREAADFLRRALAVLDHAADTSDRRRRELALRCALGEALMALGGHSTDEVRANMTRARALTTSDADALRLFRILEGMFLGQLGRAEPTTGPAFADELTSLAESLDSAPARHVATFARGFAALFHGDLLGAACLASLDDVDPTSLTDLFYGSNPVVIARAAEGFRLWLNGFPDRAAACASAAIALARTLPYRLNLTMALFFGAQVRVWRGELDAAEAWGEEGAGLAEEHGFGLWRAAFAGIAGFVRARRGDLAEADRLLRASSEGLRGVGYGLYVPLVAAELADVARRAGRIADGLATVDEGLAFVNTHIDAATEAELCRVKGELLVAAGTPWEEAETCFRRGLDFATRHAAGGYALRAATSLAEGLGTRRRTDEAHAVLAPVVAGFAEGLDTYDLRAARAVLRRLAR